MSKVEKNWGANSKRWAEPPLVGIRLTDLPNIEGASAVAPLAPPPGSGITEVWSNFEKYRKYWKEKLYKGI